MNDSKAVRITKITVGAVLLVPLLYLVYLGIVSGSAIFALGAAAVAIFPAAILWDGVAGQARIAEGHLDADDEQPRIGNLRHDELFGTDYCRHGFSRHAYMQGRPSDH